MRRIIILCLAGGFAVTGSAQRFEFFPGGTYDPKVPGPESVLGYPIGTYHTDYAGLERWLDAIRGNERVRIVRYGQSFERRPLYLVIISSPANIARLDQIQAAMKKLADPRTSTDAEAETIATSMPAVAWMNHANDGNESAAFESAIQTSYQLAAGTDETTRLVLDRLVTIVNPAHNPESHERFVAWYNAGQVGRDGTADPQAAEHHAPWGMSTNNNHYQIDLNRDAFFVSQPETAAIVKAFGEWNPVLFIDHHGQTKNMFFPPPAEAINLNVTKNQTDWMDRYGNAIGDAFDRQGWSYYRRGRFDLFFAGFWDSWPTLNGSVGLTFETDGGGSKGLAWEREDGTILTLRDGVLHHHTGTMASLRLTAEHKDQRLRDFYQFKKSAIEEGQRDPMKQVVLLPGRDAARAKLLVDTLRAQRIWVKEVCSPYRVAKAHGYFGEPVVARDVPAGAYAIAMAQPQKRLAKALLEIEPGFREDFLKNEERKKRRAELVGQRPRDGFYDTTAWSLPLLFGVDAIWGEDAVPDEILRTACAGAGGSEGFTPRYGYMFSGESFGAMRVTAQLLREGFNMAVATEPFTLLKREFPRGAVIARIERNPSTLRGRLETLAKEAGVELIPLNSARVETGSDFGEDPVVELRHPRIAVITDEPTDDRSYGATWFTLEQRLGLPFTALKTEQVRNADIGRYNVIVFPHGAPGGYQDRLGEPGIAKLRRWTQDGGTVVLLKGAAAFGTRKGVEWTASTLKRHEATIRLFFEDEKKESEARDQRPETRDQGPEVRDQKSEARDQKPGSDAQAAGPKPDAADKPLTRDMDLVRTPGAILRVKVDPEHWLGFGYDRDTAATVQSNYAFTLSRTAVHVAAFSGEDQLELGGFVWPEARKALAKSLFAWVEPAGRGQTIFFAEDPNFRASQLSTLRMFFNAVILGPSFVTRTGGL
ncbi:MAG: M14 family zinc carboxypeptidase [Vicinamibacterales bacterium]